MIQRSRTVEEKLDQGLGIRVIKGKKMGLASSTCSSPEDAERCAISACRLADLSPAGRYEDFPKPRGCSSSIVVLDKRIECLDGESAGNIAEQIVESTVSCRGIKVPKGMIRAATIWTRVINSNGIDTLNRSTLLYVDFTSMTTKGQPGEGVMRYSSPYLSGLDIDGMGKELARQAMDHSQAKPLKGSIDQVVLIPPSELSEMIEQSVEYSINAENVHKRRSPWASRTGQTVASEKLSIYDDPTDPRGPLAASADDEGVPTSKKSVIENGVLHGFLYDSYNASIDNVEPSGNGFRRSPVSSQYIFRIPVAPGPADLVITSGMKSREELRSSFDNAVVIERFAAPEVQSISGAFALEVRLGHIMRSGSIESTFHHALLVGNMYDALRNIEEIGKDQEVVRTTITPTIAFGGLHLIGSS